MTVERQVIDDVPEPGATIAMPHVDLALRDDDGDAISETIQACACLLCIVGRCMLVPSLPSPQEVWLRAASTSRAAGLLSQR